MANTTFDTHSYWLYGDSGTGKSTLCGKLAKRGLAEGESYFRHTSGDYQWWNGYAGQKVIVMEELRRNKLKTAGGLAQFLVFLDKYPIPLPVKGGFTTRHYDRVFINTAQSPVDFFTYKTNDGDIVDESIAQLIRRLDKIYELKLVSIPLDSGDYDNRVVLVDHTDELKQLYCKKLINVTYLDADNIAL